MHDRLVSQSTATDVLPIGRAKTMQKTLRPRFSLQSLFGVVSALPIFCWANLRERVVLSESPSLFNLPEMVSVNVFYGWPIAYRRNHFLVGRANVEQLVNERLYVNGETEVFLTTALAINVFVTTLILAAIVSASELMLRRRKARAQHRTATEFGIPAESP